MRLKKCVSCGKLFTGRQEQAKCDDCIAAARKTSIRRRVCRQCGSTFDGGPRAWYCPTCRAERMRAYRAYRRKTGTKRPLGSIDHCTICGKEYVVEGGRQKYCKGCAAEAYRAIDREQSKKWNKDNGYYEKRKEQGRNGVKICVICGGVVPRGNKSITCSADCRKKMLSLKRATQRQKRGSNTMIPQKIKRLDKMLVAGQCPASAKEDLLMTDRQFHRTFSDALTIQDRDAFVSDWALSSIWGDPDDAEVPPSRIEELGRIWDVAHLSIREIRAATGLTQRAFAERHCIPIRTMEDWEQGVHACPHYLRLLLAQVEGLYTRR